MEAEDIVLKKADFKDWEAMYQNVYAIVGFLILYRFSYPFYRLCLICCDIPRQLLIQSVQNSIFAKKAFRRRRKKMVVTWENSCTGPQLYGGGYSKMTA